jgi:hypothetical protein
MVFLSSLRAAWPEPVTRDEAIRAAAEIEAFLSTRMTDPNGAVTVNAVRDRPVIAGEARNDDILSETVGQMMELALLRSDREAFALQLKVLNKFIGPSGLAAWKISGTNKAADSATIDDLRIADACACPSCSAFSASRSREAIMVSNTFPVVDSGKMIL